MKKFKVTWILAGVFIFLIGYVYLVEIKLASKKEIEKEIKEKFYSFDKTKIETIYLTNTHGVFQAKRFGENEWRLEKPIQVPADRYAWNGIVDALVELKPSRTIAENVADASPYGLKLPRMKVEVTLAGQKEKVVLKVGDENPVGDSFFITNGASQKVVLAARNISYPLDKDLRQLREKKLFSFNTEASREIEIKKADQRLVLKKEGEIWNIVSLKGEKKPADSEKVKEILGAVTMLEVSDFVEEAPKEIKQYGLDHPQATVVVRNEKATQLELILGQKKELGIYVMKKSEKPVYKVDAYILDRLPVDVSKVEKKPEKKEEKKDILTTPAKK